MHFLLFIGQDGVFTGTISRGVHASDSLVFIGGTLNRIGIWSWICSIRISVRQVISFLDLRCHSHHWFVIYWWIVVRIEIRIRHTLVIILGLIRIDTHLIVLTIHTSSLHHHIIAIWRIARLSNQLISSFHFGCFHQLIFSESWSRLILGCRVTHTWHLLEMMGLLAGVLRLIIQTLNRSTLWW